MADFPYVITRFLKHKQLKKPLLNAIKQQDFSGIHDSLRKEFIYKTDWYTDSKVTREYLKILYDPITNHMYEVFNTLKHENPVYQSFWFTQYKKNNTFGRHQHRQTSWVSIYYLDMSNNTPVTHFENVFDNDIFVPNIAEGDIITFPGFVWHYSPENLSNKSKTVISFNVE
ncbi:hypothetical protein EBU94_09365 [bacterium]|nr:hypothetical protein [bacterium]